MTNDNMNSYKHRQPQREDRILKVNLSSCKTGNTLLDYVYLYITQMFTGVVGESKLVAV